MPTWLLIVICILCWGAWAVFEKQGTRHVSPLMMQIIGAYVYSAIAPIAFLYMKATGQQSTWNIPGVAWTAGACGLAAIASLAFTTAIQRAQVHLVVGFSSVYPILTFILCAIFLGEPVTWLKLVGIATICFGVTLLTW